ncbi:hypothetical protein [Methanoregula formicica]|uniref:hypothetical protein n=1 Tax=Methanoregula formicica TaxID=882104 RepID=UPI00130DA226|nr:hypothetical protein [Methanoregula formicica]
MSNPERVRHEKTSVFEFCLPPLPSTPIRVPCGLGLALPTPPLPFTLPVDDKALTHASGKPGDDFV